MRKLKTVFSVCLAAVMAASCFSLNGFAGNLNDEGSAKKRETAAGTAAYATGSIKIDGVKDALYSTTAPMNIDHVAEKNDDALFNKDFKGQTWALWDEEFLYLYTEVADKNIVNSFKGSFEETKKNDRLTYYFDFNNTQNEAVKYTGSAFVQGMYFDVRVTNDEDYNFYISDGVSRFIYPPYNDNKASAEYKAYKEFVDTTFDRAVKVTPGVGYSFEVKIKVSNLRFNVLGDTKRQDNKSGAKYGFDVYLHDRNSQKDDNRVSLSTFSKESNNMSWDFPGYLGTLTLANKPATAAKHGWLLENGNWHYYNHGTLLKQAFQDKTGTTVFLKANGNMAKNEFVTYKGKKYYVTASGALRKASAGYQKIKVGKKSYILNTAGVVQQKKSVKVGSKRYVVDKSGAVLTGNKIVTVGKAKYYVNRKGVATVKKMVTVKKAKYYFGSNGKMVKKKLVKVKGKQYYFGANGKMAKNKKIRYKKHIYLANRKGVCQKVR